MRIFALIAAFLLSSAALAEDRTIVVSGVGIVQAAPNMATISIGVQADARTAREAMDTASNAMQSVLEQLTQAGIEPRDTQTDNISLNPLYQHSNDGRPPLVSGYVAQNSLSVRVRNLDELGGVFDAVVSDGANRLNSLVFGIAEPAPLESKARAEAVRDAVSKAREIAEAAEVTLGPVLSIVETGGGGLPQPMMRGAMMEAAMDVPVAAGELTLRQQVTVTFGIE